MPEAVIVSGARTPFGTAFKGTLTETPSEALAVHVIREAVKRSRLEPELIDDAVIAQGGEATALSRWALVSLGMMSVAGQSVGRYCGGGITAASVAAGSIRSGMDQVVIAGGVHTSSLAPQARTRVPGTTDEWSDSGIGTFPPYDGWTDDVSLTVGWNVAQELGISRQQMDEWAVRSHERAVAAIDSGAFVEEIAPIDVTTKAGERVRFAVDEHPRRGSTLDKVNSLKPLHPEIESFSITAGNASGVNDGAGAMVLTSNGFAEESGLTPLATVRAWASAGIEPRIMGIAAIDAIRKVLARANMSVSDIDLWEINEAFASVPLAACQELGINDELVNVLGSGCSIGHPISATGTRMLLSLAHELRRRGGGIGLAGMCAAGGQGTAMIIEVS